MSRFEKESAKERPTIFCGKCRTWVPSAEVPQVLGRHPVWLCPSCRPEGAKSGYQGKGSTPRGMAPEKPRKIAGLQHDFEGVGGRRKGRPGRPPKSRVATRRRRV